jgi:predicted RNase H-like HicB family nuclease
MLKVYPAIITKAEGEDYGVVFPDLPGCVTTGETVENAVAMAIEALAGHVGTMIEANELVPEPAAFDKPLPDWLADIAGKVVVATVLVPVEIPSRSVRINISLDDALLARLDRAAAADHETRSGFIARAVRELLDVRRREPQAPAPVAARETYSTILDRRVANEMFAEDVAERVLSRFRREAASTADR